MLDKNYKRPSKEYWIGSLAFAFLGLTLGFQLPIIFNLLIGIFYFSIIMSMVVIDEFRVNEFETLSIRAFFNKVYPKVWFWPLNRNNEILTNLPKKAKFDLLFITSLSSWSFLGIITYILLWLLSVI